MSASSALTASRVPTSPALVVLAAGMGSRYGGLKQLDRFGPSGETLLEYSVFDALRSGFGRVVFIVREEFREVFEADVASRFRPFTDVDVVVQDPRRLPGGFVSPTGRAKPFGTVQALLAAAPLLDRPFALVNADDLYGSEALGLAGSGIAALPGSGDDAVIVTYPLGSTLSDFGPVTRGVCEVSSGYLAAIEEVQGLVRGESAAAAGEQSFDLLAPTSVNLMGFQPGVLPRFAALFEEFLATTDLSTGELPVSTALGTLLASGEVRVRALSASGGWCGVTVRDDRPMVESFVRELVASGAYPSPLWQGAGPRN